MREKIGDDEEMNMKWVLPQFIHIFTNPLPSLSPTFRQEIPDSKMKQWEVESVEIERRGRILYLIWGLTDLIAGKKPT